MQKQKLYCGKEAKMGKTKGKKKPNKRHGRKATMLLQYQNTQKPKLP